METKEFKQSLIFGLPMAVFGPIVNTFASWFAGIGEPWRSIAIFLAIFGIFIATAYLFIYALPKPKRVRDRLKTLEAGGVALAGSIVLFILSPLYTMLNPNVPLECSPAGVCTSDFNPLLITMTGIIVTIIATILYLRRK